MPEFRLCYVVDYLYSTSSDLESLRRALRLKQSWQDNSVIPKLIKSCILLCEVYF